MTSAHIRPLLLLLPALVAMSASAQGADKPVYRCPGNPVLYTDSLSAKEAKEKGCRTLEGAPITVIQSVKPRSGAVPPALSREKVDANEQRARDADARRILEAELRKEEEQLDALQKEYNNGQPERRGDEKNYQKYLDRVAEMKANIARKESDISALRRELANQPASQPEAGNRQQ
ncbi:MAG: hypothetical protein KF891_09290 [Rhizobacter sp.]|nr:hypothetical protein [Rhizobacter sp.]